MRPSPDRFEEPADRLIEVLLAEQLGPSQPPDLRDEILARWLDRALLDDQPENSDHLSPLPLRRTAKPRRASLGWFVAATVSVIMAGAAIALWKSSASNSGTNDLAQQTPVNGERNALGPSQENTPLVSPAPDSKADIVPPSSIAEVKPDKVKAADESAVATSRQRPTRERLPVDRLPMDPNAAAPAIAANASDPSGTSPALRSLEPSTPLDDRTILNQINAEFDSLWKTAKFEVASDRSADSASLEPRLWRERFLALLPPSQRDSVATSLTTQDPVLAVRESASALAQRWLQAILPPDAQKRLDDRERQALLAVLEQAFTGKQGWNKTVQRLLTAESAPNASSSNETESADDAIWLVALRSPRGVELVDQVGDVLLDADLTCARCHDHPLNSSLSQREYWGMAAVFQSEIKWVPLGEGRYGLAQPDVSAPAQLFFETQDGRSRLAMPSLPQRLVTASGTEAPTRKSLAEAALNSGTLARATINRLWEIAFGRPLVGSVADPDAPPVDPRLERVRELLAQQLAAHDYDLGLALSWIVRAKPFLVPSSLDRHGDRVLATTEQEASDRRLRWFFEFPAPSPAADSQTLLALAKQWSLPTAQVADRTRLAQIGTEGGRVGNSDSGRPLSNDSHPGGDKDLHASRHDQLRHDFPVRRTEPPVPWLRGIASYEEQARHLMYVAGVNRINENQMEWAKELHESSQGDTATALHQLWWLLRHRAL